MPSGTPTPAQLWEGNVAFFSIDTDLIQSAGYQFDKGPLHQLPKQLPRTMQLQLSEVVAREIVAHLMEPITKHYAELTTASANLTRLAQLDMSYVDTGIQAVSILTSAKKTFRQRVEEYVKGCNGGILPIEGDGLALNVFDRYFDGAAPFGKRNDKKAEFPDAMSLLLLENYAKENGTLGLIASNDGGWKEFAAQTQYLYYVSSLDDLAKLFAATDKHGQEMREKVIVEAIEEDGSPLRVELDVKLERHIEDAVWQIEANSIVNTRVEAHTHTAKVSQYSIDPASVSVWAMDEIPGTWIVELKARIEVEIVVDIVHYVTDAIDGDEMHLTDDQISEGTELEVKVFLTISNVKEDLLPEEWIIDVDVSGGKFYLDVGNVEPIF